jgi:hypothetical protein
MKIQVHKTDPVLALWFNQQEWGTNQHRCQEWVATVQGNPHFLLQQGVKALQTGRHAEFVVVLLTFNTQDEIREWMLDRRELSMDEFVKLCQEYNRNPQEYINKSQQQQQGFHFRF